MSYCYDYPRPALTVDIILYGFIEGSLRLLLVQRKNEPFKEKWALPGGFVDEHETGDEAAKRELKEETGMTCKILGQLFTETGLDRDPRGRTVSIIYRGYYLGTAEPLAGDDALNASWFSVFTLPDLAFDHQIIIKKAFTRLKENFINKPFGRELLGDKFKLSDLKILAKGILDNEKTVDIIINRMIEYEIIKQKSQEEFWHFDNIKYMWHSAFGFIRF